MIQKARLRRIETELGSTCRISAVALDLPEGKSDMFQINGEWQPCKDGRALLKELRDEPVKVYIGLDVQKVAGP